MVRAANEKSPAFYVGCLGWCGGCYWLIRNELGSIAFVGSVLLAIWAFGLRDKFEGETASSAYSVFNKGGKAIPGSLTGDQVDQQMRGGMTYHNNQTTPDSSSSDAPLTTTGATTSTSTKMTDNDKVKRRSAAAAAAERRLQQQAEEQQRQLEMERTKQS